MKRLAILALLAAAVGGSTAISQDAKTSVSPFNGKDLTGWKLKGDASKSQWKAGSATMDEKNPSKLAFSDAGKGTNDAQLVNVGTGVDISTEQKFGDAVYDIWLMVPKGSNSGIYLMGEYEVQVLDSYGRQKVGPGDLGGLYAAAAPKVNAAKKPGEWQRMIIDFQAPKFGADGKKTSNAKFLKVTLNDQVIHENVEMKGPTPGGLTGREAATGPLMFQGDHGPVAFKGIKISPK
jgi:hypothetical protein